MMSLLELQLSFLFLTLLNPLKFMLDRLVAYTLNLDEFSNLSLNFLSLVQNNNFLHVRLLKYKTIFTCKPD